MGYYRSLGKTAKNMKSRNLTFTQINLDKLIQGKNVRVKDKIWLNI